MNKLLLILILPVGLVAQNSNQPLPNLNQSNPPPVQQLINYNPVNNVDNNDRNINIQVQQQVNDDNEQQDNSNKVKDQKKEDPCPDCDKIKKAKRENYGNNGSGNYAGGANKFKRKKTWKRFCYNISHRSGGKKMKANYSMCFNW